MTHRMQRPIPSRTTPIQVSKELTIQQAIEAYLLHHQAKRSQPKTIDWHTHCLGHLHSFCEQEHLVQLSQLTLEDLQRWMIVLQTMPSNPDRPRSQRTISWYVRSLRAFWRWCLKRAFVQDDITQWLDLPVLPKTLIRILDAQELEQLIALCHDTTLFYPLVGERNLAILWVLLDTGIRLGELCGLTLTNYDIEHDILTVCGKGQKERRVALGHNAAHVLRHYCLHTRSEFTVAKEYSQIFLTNNGPLTSHGVQSMIRRLRDRLGWDERRLYPHLFRHTFAVHYLLRGGDVFTLQELLGHEDMETIRNYMHLADINVQMQKRKFSHGDQLNLRTKKARRAKSKSRKNDAV